MFQFVSFRRGLMLASLGLVVSTSAHAATYQISGGGRDITLVSDTQALIASSTVVPGTEYDEALQVKPVTLNTGPIGSTLYTQTVYGPGENTYGGGFITSDGTYALTSQTGDASGGVYAGRVFLTRITDGTSNTFDVPGNYDATIAGGQFYLTAGAGQASGLSSDSNSGVYRLEHDGNGTPTGVNLVLDTGTYSGHVSGNAAGDLVFSLGGTSVALQGGLNDLYFLNDSAIDAAIASGNTTGASASAADKLITGTALRSAVSSFIESSRPDGDASNDDFFSIADMELVGDELLLGFNHYYDWAGNVASIVLKLGLTGTDDLSANVLETVYTNSLGSMGGLAFRESDQTLWVTTDGSLIGTVIPEPTSLLALALPGLLIVAGRRGFQRA